MTARRYIADLEQRRWASDIERYDFMRRIRRVATTDQVKAHAQSVIDEIEARYPQHFKKRTTD